MQWTNKKIFAGELKARRQSSTAKEFTAVSIASKMV
jgi:hypothetical protein